MWPRLIREMTAPARGRGSDGARGGRHGLSAGRGGARHEGSRCDPARAGRQADLDPSRRDLGPQRPEHAPLAVEVRTLRRRRALRSAAPDAVAQAGPRGRGAAGPHALPRALCRLRRPALSPARPAAPSGALLLCLRQQGAAERGARRPTPAARPAPAAPRAAPLFWRAAASRRQPASVAEPGARAAVHAARRGGRCDHARAVCPAHLGRRAWRP